MHFSIKYNKFEVRFLSLFANLLLRSNILLWQTFIIQIHSTKNCFCYSHKIFVIKSMAKNLLFNPELGKIAHYKISYYRKKAIFIHFSGL